jgi:hypothetical protein
VKHIVVSSAAATLLASVALAEGLFDTSPTSFDAAQLARGRSAYAA